ncbi:MAG: phosphatase PAP2 family protein [Flavobacteriales bacterium]|nr:phosphatase PAP2 family protein [Flavobacteriales bacterium]
MGAGLALNATSLLIDVPAEKLWERHRQVDRSALNAFDRNAAFHWSLQAHRISNVVFYSTMAVSLAGPALVYREDEPLVPMALVGESFLLSAGLTGIAKVLVHRPRPYVFNPDVPEELRREREAYLSFWSGHAANTSALCISSAMLIDRSRADAGVRAAVWAGAVAVPLVMSWLRVRAGKHFPSDVLVGCLAGAVTGFVVPYFHRPENLN